VGETYSAAPATSSRSNLNLQRQSICNRMKREEVGAEVGAEAEPEMEIKELRIKETKE
jgi:hypothetical protein